MNETEQLEQLRFAISRYDHYYESINSKGNLYLALNSILIGGIAASYPFIDQKLHLNARYNLVLIAIVLQCALSLITTIAAINPFTKSGLQSGQISLLYYGQVSQLEFSFFSRRFRKRTLNLHVTDMLRQMHTLARGLNRKFQLLKWAGLFLSGALLLLISATLMLILKNIQ